MSKPRDGWWSYAKYMVRVYPARLQELQELRAQRPAQSGEKPKGGKSRPTESLALRELPAARQRELDAVRLALERQSLQSYPELRRELVRLVYWERSCNLLGAAARLHIGEATAKRWHADFIRSVGRCAGLCD